MIDWQGGIGILFLLAALALFTARCQPLVPPPPDPGPPIEPTKPGDCSSACARLRELGCPWAAPTPAGGTCEEVCEVAEAAPETTMNPACVSKAASCDGAEACTR